MILSIFKKIFRLYTSSRNNFTPLCLYCSFAVIDSAHIDVINKKPLLLKKLPYIFLLLLHITKLQHSCLSFILLSKKKNNIIQCVLINVASFDTRSEIFFFSFLVFFSFFSLLQNGTSNFIKMHLTFGKLRY